MSQEHLEVLLGRLLTDDSLRQRAATQLDAICDELKLTVTPEELASIKPEDLVRLSMASSWLNSKIKRTEQLPARHRQKVDIRS
jgi:hypothetical protein